MSYFTDVKDFQEAFGQRVGTHPELPDLHERALRLNLLTEEVAEYAEAEINNDLVEVADALADIIYIACGTAVSYGIPLDRIFDEVHRSNMAKLVDGKVIRREDGKIQKPEGWTPPDIETIIKEEQNNYLTSQKISL
jgi:predicted HAD superfamily Cof-like phosphohydrolase